MTECLVCCDKLTVKNKLVICSHCEYSACVTCQKTYILGSLNRAKCMGCYKEWSREFLHENFTQSFINKEYKKHREDILFDGQKCMMQDTQTIASTRIKAAKINVQIQEIKNKVWALQTDIRNLENKKWNLQSTKKVETKKKEQFFGHCPVSTCRGFIESNWKCGICEINVCKRCKEIETADHICDENTVVALKLIKKDCRPCPRCKVPIIRASGCYQMWCTNCHISYDWKTGEIVTNEVIHNPHFIEWQRSQGVDPDLGARRRIGIDACGRHTVENANFDSILIRMKKENRNFIVFFNRFLNHCHGVERRRFRVNQDDTESGNYLELRIKYLNNTIDEEQFKSNIQREKKKNDKKYDYYLIIDMFVQSGRDILNQYFRNPVDDTFSKTISETQLSEAVSTIDKLIIYTNSSFENSANIYKNKKLTISKQERERRFGNWNSRITEKHIDFDLI
jgi:hypothetical protein